MTHCLGPLEAAEHPEETSFLDCSRSSTRNGLEERKWVFKVKEILCFHFLSLRATVRQNTVYILSCATPGQKWVGGETREGKDKTKRERGESCGLEVVGIAPASLLEQLFPVSPAKAPNF